MAMESPSSAVAAGDGCAAENEEVTSPIEQKMEVLGSSHGMSNGSYDYRFMKNGKPRPSAVRDFPKNIIPAYKISDVSKEQQENDLPVPCKEKGDQKQIKEDMIVPETEMGAESNVDINMGKAEKVMFEKSHPDQKPGKASMLPSKKLQEESKKRGVASPDMPKPIKEKDASKEKTQKTPTKPANKKVSGTLLSASGEAEVEPNKGKGTSPERVSKLPTKVGKTIEKKASANALTASDAPPKETEGKVSKGKLLSQEKSPKTSLKVGKSLVKKLSGAALSVSDDSLKDVEDEPSKEEGAQTEEIQKISDKKAIDPATTVLNGPEGAKQEVIDASQGEVEGMDIHEELCAEIEQDEQKEEKPLEETKGEKPKKLHPGKRKAGIRDLPEISKPVKDKVAAVELAKGHVVHDLDMEEGLQEELTADNAKLDGNGKKKRPIEEPDSSDKSRKVLKSKALDVAQSAKESSSLVVTPKARKPIKKSSTPTDSGKKVRRSAGKAPKPTTMTDKGDARKLILESLRQFDAARRKFLLDEEKTTKSKGNRADLRAASLLKNHNTNRGVEKAQGPLPGLSVGDIFLLRTELSFARVHGPIQAGIEYLTAKESEYNTPVAISIVSNVGQDGEDKGEDLVYTGQGGRSADNKQIADQKLERGNLALDGCKKYNVPVRMIRGIKDVNSPSGKVYVYDGLYNVEEMFTAKGSGGFNEFKFRLKRMPGQAELGSDMLYRANDLKSQAPLSRKDVVVPDISKGKESQAICVENTVDDDRGPASFEYTTKLVYPDDVENLESSVGCKCKGGCMQSSTCGCFSKNGDELPYLNGGYLVRQKDYVFECGNKCSCSSSCRNRATERGLRFRLDVFKTEDRGWGVRSLDLIPAGSFICEYIGKLIADEEEIKAVSDREHMLFTRRLRDTMPRWGDLPSIFPDRSSSTIMPDVGNPQFIIDASSIGNVSRFINHSCSPNLLIQKVLSEHQDVRYPHFKLFAMDNIPPMRELTFDYGHPSDEELVSEELSTACLCGSPDCRGKLYL